MPSCEAHCSRLSGNFWERQKVHVCHFSGEDDSTRQSSLGLSWCVQTGRRERETGRRIWEPAKAGFGLDKLLVSWLAWIVTYYLLKWKENLKTEASVTTPTFLSTGSRHTAAFTPQTTAACERKSRSLLGNTGVGVTQSLSPTWPWNNPTAPSYCKMWWPHRRRSLSAFRGSMDRIASCQWLHRIMTIIMNDDCDGGWVDILQF